MYNKNYSQTVIDNFKKGYNCSQSVLLAFAEEVGLTTETALKLASSFGGGMGRMREVCGAVSAMFMIAGFIKGYTAPDNDEQKARHYALIQNLAEEFKKKYNTIICRELIGEDGQNTLPTPSKRTDEYYAKRPCEDFIAEAARLSAKLLNE